MSGLDREILRRSLHLLDVIFNFLLRQIAPKSSTMPLRLFDASQLVFGLHFLETKRAWDPTECLF